MEMKVGSTRYKHKHDHLAGKTSFSETTDIFTGETDEEDSMEAF
jgi:hypothetical protein